MNRSRKRRSGAGRIAGQADTAMAVQRRPAVDFVGENAVDKRLEPPVRPRTRAEYGLWVGRVKAAGARLRRLAAM